MKNPVGWLKSLFGTKGHEHEKPLPGPPKVHLPTFRPRTPPKHPHGRKWWLRRKSRMRMAKESRRRNRL